MGNGFVKPVKDDLDPLLQKGNEVQQEHAVSSLEVLNEPHILSEHQRVDPFAGFAQVDSPACSSVSSFSDFDGDLFQFSPDVNVHQSLGVPAFSLDSSVSNSPVELDTPISHCQSPVQSAPRTVFGNMFLENKACRRVLQGRQAEANEILTNLGKTQQGILIITETLKSRSTTLVEQENNRVNSFSK